MDSTAVEERAPHRHGWEPSAAEEGSSCPVEVAVAEVRPWISRRRRGEAVEPPHRHGSCGSCSRHGSRRVLAARTGRGSGAGVGDGEVGETRGKEGRRCGKGEGVGTGGASVRRRGKGVRGRTGVGTRGTGLRTIIKSRIGLLDLLRILTETSLITNSSPKMRIF